MLTSCPNCLTRPADTQTHYDELVHSRYTKTSYRYGRYQRSFTSVSQSGDVALCSDCAAKYVRMVHLRALGATIGNRGFVALLLSLLLLVFVYNVSAGKGAGIYVSMALVGLCGCAVLVGSVLAITSRLMRRSATRFLRRPSS